MYMTPRVMARSAVLVSLGLFTMAVPIARESNVARAQGTPQITLNVDAPTAGITLVNGQPVTIGGWAGVPGGRDSGIVAVDVYLDGGPETGTAIGSARLRVARQDVARVTGRPEWANSGFNLDWVPRYVSQGPHTLYVVARTATGESTTQTLQVTGCGCGVSHQGSFTNPIVRQVRPGIWEVDTGGPGVRIERDIVPFPWW